MSTIEHEKHYVPVLDLSEIEGRHDLVTVSEIAALAGVQVATVSNWTIRHADFPSPRAAYTRGLAYSRHDVQAWLRRTGRLVRAFEKEES